jgi:hypothetical protein
VNGAAGDADNDQEEDDDLSGEEEEEGDEDDEGWFLSTVLDPHLFQCGSGFILLGQCGSLSSSGSRALTTKCKVLHLDKNPIFYYKKLQFIYPKASKKDVQPTEEVFMLNFSGFFVLLIQPTKISVDPDPQHRFLQNIFKIYFCVR